MSGRQGLRSGAAWMFAGTWVEQAINILVFVALARLLGAEQWGLAMMAMSIVVLAEFIARETVTEVIVQLDSLQPGHLNAAFFALSGLSLGVVGLLWAIADPVAALYSAPQVADLLRALSLNVLVIGVSGVPVALLRRGMRFRILSLRAMAGVVAGGVVGLFMALTGWGVWALVGQRAAQVLTNNVMAWPAAGWRPDGWPGRDETAAVLRQGLRLVGYRAAELAAVQTPFVVVGATLGAAALGFFSVAWRLVEILTFLMVTPLRLVAQSGMADIRRAGGDGADLLSRVLAISTVLAIPVFVGLALLADPIVMLQFGPDWAPAVPTLRVMAGFGLYLAVERLAQAAALAAGAAGPLFRIASTEALAGVALMIAAAPFGLTAVAMAILLRAALFWPLRMRLTARICGVGAIAVAQLALAPLLASLVMASAVLAALAVLPLDAAPLVRVLLAMAIGAAVYPALLWLIDRGRVRELLAALRPRRAEGNRDPSG